MTLRLARIVVVLFAVSILTFLLLSLLPGDPAVVIAGENATPEQIAQVREELRLDDPFLKRYVAWLGDALHGDFGRSIRSHQPVVESLTERLPVTLEVAFLGLVIALVVSLPLGILAAARPGGVIDRGMMLVTSALLSVPPFVVAILLVYLFAVQLEIFPVTGWVRLTQDPAENLRYAFLPALALAVNEIAVFSRLLRNDMIGTLQEDYILAARTRGLPRHRILLRHALRPSLFSLMTVLGVSLGRLIGGSVLIESIFAIPGVGRLTLDAISTRDYTVVQAVVLLVGVTYVMVNAIVDLLYPLLDPRLRTRSA